MNLLIEKAQVEELLRRDSALIFKHSTSCAISSIAHREVEKFISQNPGSQVHKVHVIEDRDLSNFIAQQTSVAHASPQMIVLRQGRVHWHSSHFGITAGRIAKNLSVD
ncbi:MAG TPA: bacillithiol system redox-active protein YtxJ [Acidobacteriota bacterium]|nr:bacillithiol system redox-active protein YtxJ [Acidobacteriota bacterium]